MPVPCLLLQYFLGVLLLLDLAKHSHQYKTLTVEDSDLCSPIKNRKIKLGRGPKSGLLVKQTRLNDHSLHWDKNLLCRFKLETSKHNHKEDGLFAVVQYLVFRKNETSGECIDYVQFRGHDGSASRQFCGRMNYALNMDHNFVEPFVSSPISSSNAFVDSKGELEVTIFVSKEPLRADEEMDLTMLFTAYRYCYLTLLNENDYKPCGVNHQEVCIYDDFFKDGYVNCPYPDCVDEGGCNDKTDVDKRQSVGNRVLIGSVSLLFIMFAVFICCLWACRKHKVFCWSEDFAHPSPQPPQSPTRVMEMSEQTGSRLQATQNAPASVPTAPSLEEDKPPSYDSLFPSR